MLSRQHSVAIFIMAITFDIAAVATADDAVDYFIWFKLYLALFVVFFSELFSSAGMQEFNLKHKAKYKSKHLQKYDLVIYIQKKSLKS